MVVWIWRCPLYVQVMVALSDIEAFSPDDDEAFVQFEALCRQRLENATANLGHDDSWEDARREYMARVLAAAEVYQVPGYEELSELRTIDAQAFPAFDHEVLKIVTRLQVGAARRKSAELVELEPSDQVRIKADVERLKNRVDASQAIEPAKKKVILRKLDDLLAEIAKPKVRYVAVMVTLMALAPFAGQVEDDLIKLPQTIIAVLDTLALAKGKQDERQAVLDRYRRPKELEHHPAVPKAAPIKPPSPKSTSSPRGEFIVDLDDEIPF